MSQSAEGSDTIDIDPIAIATKYQPFITGGVSRVYGLAVDSLRIDPTESFMDAEDPNAVFCYVYDHTGTAYGVAVELSQETGEPIRYRCQKIER